MAQDWHWLDKQGVQRVASAQLLADAIVHGVVSRDAPLWRPGMATFVPASRLADFADACKRAGSRRSDGSQPALPGEIATPDAEATAALQRTLDEAKGRRPAPPRKPLPPPPPTAGRTAKPDAATLRLGTLREADTVRPPPASIKPAGTQHSGTLLGFGPPAPPPTAPAPPPPPAQIMKDAAPSEPLAEVLGPASPQPEPPPPIASVEFDRFEDTPPATPMARDSHRAGDRPASGAPPLPTPVAPPALQSPDDAPAGVDVVAVPVRRANPSIDPDAPSVILPPPSVRPPEPSRADQTLRTKAIRSRRLVRVVVGVVAGAALLGVVAIGMRALRGKPGRPATTGAPRASTPASSPAASAAVSALPSAAPVPSATVPAPASSEPCTFRGARKRIVVGASKDVPIEVWAQPDDPRVAVGFAKQDGSALGFVLDPKTLEPKKSFAEKSSSPIRRVVPTRTGDAITFAVDADDPQAPLKNTLTVATNPPLRLGTFKDALTIEAVDSTVPDVLWTMPSDKRLEAMRATVVPSRGLAIVFRMDERVWLGWVTEERKPLGKLTRIPGSGVRVGTPSISWNGRDVLVAFADLPARDAAWAIRTARVAYGEESVTSEPWTLPPGGLGGAAIAPSVFGLADGRWLMVWTEGASGSRDVRVQTYDASLHALGDAFTVSEAGANAGQGVAAVGSAGGVVMYLSVLGKMYEVWGASIDCP